MRRVMLLKRLVLYLKLARFHQPAGIWLLLFPCWWSIAMAVEKPVPDIYLLTLFAIGATVMRAAGCVINDIIDVKIDAQVTRTKDRPLASGALSLAGALWLLIVLLTFGLAVLARLNAAAILIALSSCMLVIIYPFTKRFFAWPQLFLAMTFNIGALAGWAAARGQVEAPAVLLYGAGIFWTLGYDTIYAHQDKRDDKRIGIKSSALSLRERTKSFVALSYLLSALLLLWCGAMVFPQHNAVFYSSLILGLAWLSWQVWRVNLDDPASCLRAFRSNVWFGAIVFAGILLEKTLSYM